MCDDVNASHINTVKHFGFSNGKLWIQVFKEEILVIFVMIVWFMSSLCVTVV